MAEFSSIRLVAIAYKSRLADILGDTQADLFMRLQNLTPIDTGAAKKSWAIDERGMAGYTIHTTGIPYFRKIEYGGFTTKPETPKTINGYSKQAPKGVIRETAKAWPEIVHKAFAKYMRG